ncbi:MAG: cyclohexanone monooxygenase, partial [Nitrospinae bacterium]|nr:cyclohexanone monooxygenase [Nitrospinota bacterium]
ASNPVAMTGTLLRIDIRGRGGRTLQDKWKEGPRTYLGLMTAGFPNMFTITGPGSPSVLTNMQTSIDHHVEWIGACLVYLRENGMKSIEASVEAEDAWVAHNNEETAKTIRYKCSSWYLGANIPGKPRVFMPYIAGFDVYSKKCAEIVEAGYEGFHLIRDEEAAPCASVLASPDGSEAE